MTVGAAVRHAIATAETDVMTDATDAMTAVTTAVTIAAMTAETDVMTAMMTAVMTAEIDVMTAAVATISDVINIIGAAFTAPIFAVLLQITYSKTSLRDGKNDDCLQAVLMIHQLNLSAHPVYDVFDDIKPKSRAGHITDILSSVKFIK